MRSAKTIALLVLVAMGSFVMGVVAAVVFVIGRFDGLDAEFSKSMLPMQVEALVKLQEGRAEVAANYLRVVASGNVVRLASSRIGLSELSFREVEALNRFCDYYMDRYASSELSQDSIEKVSRLCRAVHDKGRPRPHG